MIQKVLEPKWTLKVHHNMLDSVFPVSESFQILLIYKQCLTLLSWIAVRIIER